MSSLRPLITITLLAAVGVVLYMKINETEPVIPAGVGEWSAGPLDVVGAEAGASTTTTKPPVYAADAAPAFVASTPAPSKTATPPGDAAPAWTPPPIAAETPAVKPAENSPTTTNADSSPVARTAEPAGKLPEMPPLPGADTSKEAATAKPPATDPTTPSTASDAAAVAAPIVGAAVAATAVEAATASKTEPAPASTKPETLSAAMAPPATAAADPITPTGPTPDSPATSSPKAEYASARVAVQAALDRGELAEALQLLSDWYDDPSLTPAESTEVNNLLGQLAGSVIYEGPPAHRLEKAYKVQAGETLQNIAAKYDVPWPLLAKINGIADPGALQPGQELKVMRGPFSAVVDLSERKMTLMLDRRYAGKFAIEVDPAATIEEGQWKVDQKLLTPGGGGLYAQAAGATEDRSLLLNNPANPTGQTIVVRGPGNNDPVSAQPAGRVIRMKAGDVSDLYDILSEKSRITVRR